MQGNGGTAGWLEVVAAVHAFMSESLSIEIYEKTETESGAFYCLRQAAQGVGCTLALIQNLSLACSGIIPLSVHYICLNFFCQAWVKPR